MRRIHSLDYLKTFLALFVVLAHTNWIQNNMTPGLFVFGNGIMRILVPLFCIIAGYFLQTSVVRGKAGKWLWRVMALYLFWMAAYLPIWHGQVTGLWSFATTMLWGFFHLWFLIGLFFGGLAVVALNWLGGRIAPQRRIWFIMVPAAICAAIGLEMEYADLAGYADIAVQRYRNGLFMCFPFVAIGFVIRGHIARVGFEALPRAGYAAAVFGVGMILLCVEAWLVQSRFGLGVMIEIPVMTYVVVPALFVLALQVELPPQPVDLGLVSASIYFIHVWAFRLADLLNVEHLLGLMVIGAGLPTLIALIYGPLAAKWQHAPRKVGQGSQG